MKAEIIAIGSELLSGIQETNSSFISERLALAGINLRSIAIVRDSEDEIADALRKALERSDLIIITGGLGPTEDDLTKKTIAKVLGKRLILAEDIIDRIKEYFKGINLDMPKNNEKQALIPFGARAIPNKIGTAPGFIIEQRNSLIVCLPGPPKEMRSMFQSIEPILNDKYGGKVFTRSEIIRTCGLHESLINELLRDILNKRDNSLEIGIFQSELGIDIRIVGTGPREEIVIASIKTTEEKVRERLRDYVYGIGNDSLESIVGVLLREKGLRISIAESCTGGLIAHRITNIPRSSDYFERGIVCYSNKSKIEDLNIPSRIIEEYGSISKEVAIAMAEGIRLISMTDIGLSTTGVAGPTGGPEGKPIGLVYIALAYQGGTEYTEYRFISDREGIKIQASQMALDMLRRYLINL